MDEHQEKGGRRRADQSPGVKQKLSKDGAVNQNQGGVFGKGSCENCVGNSPLVLCTHNVLASPHFSESSSGCLAGQLAL